MKKLIPGMFSSISDAELITEMMDMDESNDQTTEQKSNTSISTTSDNTKE